MEPRAKTTRYEMEVSTGWAKDAPELFRQAVEEFIAEAVQYDLFDVRMKIDRVGFITFIALPENKSQ